MLMIRFQRVGRKNDANFRLVATDSRRAAKSGAYLEMLGFYNPKNKKVDIKADRLEYWLSKGAKMSESAKSLAKKVGIDKKL